MAHALGRGFVVRVARSSLEHHATLLDDLAFVRENGFAPILIAPDRESARRLVRAINISSNEAVCVSGADAATIPAAYRGGIGKVQIGLLEALARAGFLPVLEPVSYAPFGGDIEIDADNLAAVVAAATDADRAIFFVDSGGVPDPETSAKIAELTVAEAELLAEDPRLDLRLRGIIRAAVTGVRHGVQAAQIIDGRIAHAMIMELLTKRHLGTQVSAG
jgi:acetylglutamate kinase